MSLTKLAITCVVLMAGQTSSDKVYTNLRSGRIPVEVHPGRRDEIREMQLFVSPDKGKTWSQIDKATPDKDGFTYFAQSDGEYWYHVVIVNQQGKREPENLYKAPPIMKLVVDTKAPELKIMSAQRQGNDLVVSWSVSEENPDPPQLKLEYRAADSNVWTPMTLNPTPVGTAKTPLNTSAPLVVRLSFKDLANNAAVVEAPVAGALAVVGYSPGGELQKTAATQPALDLPPPANEKSVIPPPPPNSTGPGGLELPGLPPGARSVGQPGPGSAAKPAAIASTSDMSQGSPVPAQQPAAAANRSLPQLQVVNEPEIEVEYEVSKVGPSGLGKVEVWITRDAGANWVRFAEDPEASQATTAGKYKRTLMLPGEGVYGISLVVKSKAGMGKAAPRSGDIPEMLVEVDTTPPEAQLLPLMPDPQRRDTLILSWTAKDRNLGPAPITLEWAERPTGPWQPIATGLQNTGPFAWHLPPSLPSHVYLKLTVRDTAGNVAVAVTRDPQLVDLSEPEGRLIRVAPVNKKQ
jgi:hypothetical protein